MKFALRLFAVAGIGIGLMTASWAGISGAAEEHRFDVVIKGGRVVDGTGTSSYVADVAIKDGKIAAIGRLDEKDADEKSMPQGLVVAPGFHRHDGPDRDADAARPRRRR